MDYLQMTQMQGRKEEHMRGKGVTEKGKKLFLNLLSATDL